MSELKLYQFQNIAMEQICPECQGKCALPDYKPELHCRQRCLNCGGEGKVLTPEGKNFMDFVARHYNFLYQN